jgi:membrane protein implicated in regulation of membrane protease activity
MGIGKFDILAPIITDWVTPITYNWYFVVVFILLALLSASLGKRFLPSALDSHTFACKFKIRKKCLDSL